MKTIKNWTQYNEGHTCRKHAEGMKKDLIPSSEDFDIDKYVENRFIEGARLVIPGWDKIYVSPRNKYRAGVIFQDFLDNGGFEGRENFDNNCSIGSLNEEIMKIMEEMKKKYKHGNWQIIQKPMYEKIHGALT